MAMRPNAAPPKNGGARGSNAARCCVCRQCTPFAPPQQGAARVQPNAVEFRLLLSHMQHIKQDCDTALAQLEQRLRERVISTEVQVERMVRCFSTVGMTHLSMSEQLHSQLQRPDGRPWQTKQQETDEIQLRSEDKLKDCSTSVQVRRADQGHRVYEDIWREHGDAQGLGAGAVRAAASGHVPSESKTSIGQGKDESAETWEDELEQIKLSELTPEEQCDQVFEKRKSGAGRHGGQAAEHRRHSKGDVEQGDVFGELAVSRKGILRSGRQRSIAEQAIAEDGPVLSWDAQVQIEGRLTQINEQITRHLQERRAEKSEQAEQFKAVYAQLERHSKDLDELYARMSPAGSVDEIHMNSAMQKMQDVKKDTLFTQLQSISNLNGFDASRSPPKVKPFKVYMPDNDPEETTCDRSPTGDKMAQARALMFGPEDEVAASSVSSSRENGPNTRPAKLQDNSGEASRDFGGELRHGGRLPPPSSPGEWLCRSLDTTPWRNQAALDVTENIFERCPDLLALKVEACESAIKTIAPALEIVVEDLTCIKAGMELARRTARSDSHQLSSAEGSFA